MTDAVFLLSRAILNSQTAGEPGYRTHLVRLAIKNTVGQGGSLPHDWEYVMRNNGRSGITPVEEGQRSHTPLSRNNDDAAQYNQVVGPVHDRED